MQTNGPRFKLGQLVGTLGALEAIQASSGDTPSSFLVKHSSGDWGDLDAEDKATNEQAVELGYRILSAYRLSTDVKLYVITEADRSSTCLLLASEY